MIKQRALVEPGLALIIALLEDVDLLVVDHGSDALAIVRIGVGQNHNLDAGTGGKDFIARLLDRGVHLIIFPVRHVESDLFVGHRQPGEQARDHEQSHSHTQQFLHWGTLLKNFLYQSACQADQHT